MNKLTREADIGRPSRRSACTYRIVGISPWMVRRSGGRQKAL
jgi:hypothetical protein